MMEDHTKEHVYSVTAKEAERAILAKQVEEFGEGRIRKIPQGIIKGSKGEVRSGGFSQSSKFNEAARKRVIKGVLTLTPFETGASYLSSREAAKYLGLPAQALDRARANGNLVGERPPKVDTDGKFYRYSIKVLDRWLIKFKKKHQK